MQNKRVLFIILFVIGLLAIGGIVYWTVFRDRVTALPVPQQGSVEVSQTSSTVSTGSGATGATIPAPAPDPVSPQEQERRAREALLREARDTVTRLGTVTNANEFSSAKIAYTRLTKDAQAAMDAMIRSWQEAHPLARSSYGQTTRALAARVTSQDLISTGNRATVEVDVQVVIQEGDAQRTETKQVELTYVKQGDVWLISNVAWKEMVL